MDAAATFTVPSSSTGVITPETMVLKKFATDKICARFCRARHLNPAREAVQKPLKRRRRQTVKPDAALENSVNKSFLAHR